MYGSASNARFRSQTCANLQQLNEHLVSVPKIKVQLRFGYVWGEDCRRLGPGEYMDTLMAGVQFLQSNGVDFDVHVKTHPRFMDDWVDLLVSTFFQCQIIVICVQLFPFYGR